MSCKCQKCGKQYKVDINVPNEIWDKINPEGKLEGDGMLCGSCIMEAIEKFNEYGAYFLSKLDNK